MPQGGGAVTKSLKDLPPRRPFSQQAPRPRYETQASRGADGLLRGTSREACLQPACVRRPAPSSVPETSFPIGPCGAKRRRGLPATPPPAVTHRSSPRSPPACPAVPTDISALRLLQPRPAPRSEGKPQTAFVTLISPPGSCSPPRPRHLARLGTTTPRIPTEALPALVGIAFRMPVSRQRRMPWTFSVYRNMMSIFISLSSA